MKIIKNSFLANQNQELKMLVLSDLHIYDNKSLKKLNKIKEYLDRNKYDIICLVGDVIDATNMLLENNEVYNKLLDFIKYLGDYAKTYIVYGSHDISYRNYKKQTWENKFEIYNEKFLNVVNNYKNVKVLRNEIVDLGNGYTISGFNPSYEYAYKKNNNNKYLFEDGKLNFLNNLDSNKTNIFLCHYPDVIITLSKVGYLNKVDLGIAGHNHNGMTQFGFFPLETILNLFGQRNRGLITPFKSITFKKTQHLRGIIKLNNRCTLVINPAVTSLANCTGALKYLDGLFYTGATEIHLIPKEK